MPTEPDAGRLGPETSLCPDAGDRLDRLEIWLAVVVRVEPANDRDAIAGPAGRNTAAIPGARTIEQLEENAAAADLVLAPDDLARLSAEAERFDAAQRR